MTRAGRGGLLRCGWGRRRDEEEEEEEDRTGGTQEFSPSPTFHSGLQRIVSDTRVNACTCTHRGTHATTTHIQPSVRERARARTHVRTYPMHTWTYTRARHGWRAPTHVHAGSRSTHVLSALTPHPSYPRGPRRAPMYAHRGQRIHTHVVERRAYVCAYT